MADEEPTLPAPDDNPLFGIPLDMSGGEPTPGNNPPPGQGIATPIQPTPPPPPQIDNRPPGQGLPPKPPLGLNPPPLKPVPPKKPGDNTPVPPSPTPTPGGPPPDNTGGGCPCPTGSGGDTGGGPTSPPGPSCPPPPNACRKHDGTIIDKDTGQSLSQDAWGGVLYNQGIEGCEGTIDASAIPYCDDVPCPPPPQTPEDKAGQCCKDAFKAIADAMKDIKDAINKKYELTQEEIDKWLDYIAKKIKDKIIPPAKTCSECCKRVEIGLATAAECAIVAANCTCQACADQCESWMEGQCCKNCGSTNCTCKGGKCVGDDKPPKKWTAWCDYTTGVHLSTDDGKPPPVVGDWTNAGTFDTFEQSDAISCNMQDTGGSDGHGGSSGGYHLPPVVLPDQTWEGVCESQRYANRIVSQKFLNSMPVPNVEARVIVGVKNAVGAMASAGSNPIAAATAAITGLAQVAAGAWFTDIAGDIISAASGLTPSAVKPAITTLATIGIAEELCGISLPQTKLPIEYAFNAATRPRVYTPEQAIAAALAGRIEVANVDRYFAAAGFCEEVSQGVIEAAKSKPVVSELIRMRRREMVDKEDYQTRMRQLGYLDQDVPEALYNLSEVIPGPSDIVRFMQRDTDDPAIVDRFKLDDQFEDKFGDQLKEWAKHQGVPDEVMKRFWRAHWEIPSASALREFLIRLRYDDIPAESRVSIDDVRTALVQQDILPHWVDKYIATMYSPLGRIDIRRSYQSGTLSDDETKRALAELGYNDDNVDKLFKFMQKLKEQSAVNHRAIKRWVALLNTREQVQSEMQDDGYTADQVDKALDTASTRLVSSAWGKAYIAGEIDEVAFRNLLTGHGVSADSVNAIVELLSYRIVDAASVKAYLAGILTRTSALDRMTSHGMQASIARSLLDKADDTFNAAHAAKCAANIKSRYIRGAIDAADAKDKLIVNGIASEWADRLIGKWKCELTSKDKALTADKLCGAYARGSIAGDELKQRLIRLGYSEPDSLLMLGDCAERISTQQAKAEEKRRKQEQADKAKVAATARKALADGQKIAAQAEAMRKAKNQLRATRQTQELTTLKNLTKKCHCTNAEAVAMFVQNSDRIQSEFGFTKDEANRILLRASEIWSDGKPDSFAPVVDELSKAMRVDEANSLIPEP